MHGAVTTWPIMAPNAKARESEIAELAALRARIEASGVAGDDRDENGLDESDRMRNALVGAVDHIDAGHFSTRRAIERLLPTINTFLNRAAATAPPEWWTLEELLTNPDLSKPPPVVVPHLAWFERVTLLSSREKRGKSTLLAAGAAAVSHGRSFLGAPAMAGKVVWVYYEGHRNDVIRTLSAAGAYGPNVAIMRGRPNEWEPLITLIKDVKPVWVVMDTLASFALGGLVTESSRAEQWTPVMNMFSRQAQDLHCAFTLSHHDKKSGGGYADSRAIGAGADMLLNIPGEPGDPSPRREINGIGRWDYTNIKIRRELDGSFVLDGPATPTIELGVLDYVRKNPGSSKNAIRDGMQRSKDVTDPAIVRLLAQNLVENRGTRDRHKYYPVELAVDAQSDRGRQDDPSRGSATVPATPAASAADVAGQRLTQPLATPAASCVAPIGATTATVVPALPINSPLIACSGGCGKTFHTLNPHLPITCRECRAKAHT